MKGKGGDDERVCGGDDDPKQKSAERSNGRIWKGGPTFDDLERGAVLRVRIYGDLGFLNSGSGPGR